MSSARILEAFELSQVAPAVKLAAIFIGDNWTEYDRHADVESASIADFCCISLASVEGILSDMVYVGLLSSVESLPHGFHRLHFTNWIEAIRSRSGTTTIDKSVRRFIVDRDVSCVYCDQSEGPFHIDHILPRSRGGSDQIGNLALACAPCNISKRDRTPQEWGGMKGRSYAPRS